MLFSPDGSLCIPEQYSIAQEILGSSIWYIPKLEHEIKKELLSGEWIKASELAERTKQRSIDVDFIADLLLNQKQLMTSLVDTAKQRQFALCQGVEVILSLAKEFETNNDLDNFYHSTFFTSQIDVIIDSHVEASFSIKLSEDEKKDLRFILPRSISALSFCLFASRWRPAFTARWRSSVELDDKGKQLDDDNLKGTFWGIVLNRYLGDLLGEKPENTMAASDRILGFKIVQDIIVHDSKQFRLDRRSETTNLFKVGRKCDDSHPVLGFAQPGIVSFETKSEWIEYSRDAGNVAFHVGEFECAIRLYSTLYKFIDDEPEKTGVLLSIASCYELLSDFENALKIYNNAWDVAATLTNISLKRDSLLGVFRSKAKIDGQRSGEFFLSEIVRNSCRNPTEKFFALAQLAALNSNDVLTARKYLDLMKELCLEGATFHDTLSALEKKLSA